MQFSLDQFEGLYRQHYSAVRGLCYKYNLSTQQIDDAIQDTFVKAWEKISTLQDESSFRPWLMMIARNECLMVKRSQKKIVPISGESPSEDDDTMEMTLASDDPLATFEFEQCLSLLRELIEAHKKEPRARIARMFYLQSLSIKEICDRTGLKQNTVLSHLRRFRTLITDAMLTQSEAQGLHPYI